MSTIAVIITTYDRNRRLRQAIDSVRNQTVSPDEILVVDGTKTGNAASVVDDYPEVEYHQQTSDSGPHRGRSEGFARVDSDYVQFLDDDDRLKPQKLERQSSLLDDSSTVGVAYCGVEYETGEIDLPKPSVRGNILDEILSFDPGDCLMTSSMLCDATVLDASYPFRNTHGADDIGWQIELARRTEYDYVAEPLVVAGEHDDHRGKTWKSIAGRRLILEQYGELYAERNPDIRRSALAETNQQTARRYLDERIWDPRAIWHYGKALYYYPDTDTNDYVEFVTSFGGRPMKQLASRIYRELKSDRSTQRERNSTGRQN